MTRSRFTALDWDTFYQEDASAEGEQHGVVQDDKNENDLEETKPAG